MADWAPLCDPYTCLLLVVTADDVRHGVARSWSLWILAQFHTQVQSNPTVLLVSLLTAASFGFISINATPSVLSQRVHTVQGRVLHSRIHACCLQGALLKAAKRGDVESVQRCLDAGVSLSCTNIVSCGMWVADVATREQAAAWVPAGLGVGGFPCGPLATSPNLFVGRISRKRHPWLQFRNAALAGGDCFLSNIQLASAK
jgi:hypothetical protein